MFNYLLIAGDVEREREKERERERKRERERVVIHAFPNRISANLNVNSFNPWFELDNKRYAKQASRSHVKHKPAIECTFLADETSNTENQLSKLDKIYEGESKSKVVL